MARLNTLKPTLATLGSTLVTASASVRMRGRALQRERAAMLRANPLCSGPDSLCERYGIVREATERDHVVPLERGGAEHRSNAQMLCRECHAHKSARETRERVRGWAGG